MLSLCCRTSVLALALAATACGEVLLFPDGGGGDDDVDARTGAIDAGGADPDAALVDPCAGPEIDLAHVADCLLPAQCEFLLACNAYDGTGPECVEFLGASNDILRFLRRVEDAIAAGRVRYDGAAAFECVDAIDPSNCASGFESDACDRVFLGDVAAGGACFDSDECAVAGSSCDAPGCELQCCLGECLAPAGIGAACGGGISCELGSYCVMSAAGGPALCRTGDAGSPCTTHNHCDAELYCRGSSCTADHALGTHAICNADEECRAPERCVGDDVDGAGTCEVADSDGDPCDNACDGPLYCNAPAGSEGMCRALPTLGGDCAVANRCQDPYLCNQTTDRCVARPGEDDACRSFQCEAGLFCTSEVSGAVTGTCRAPLPDNMPCTSDRQCASGVCADNAAGNRQCLAYMVCTP